MTKQNNTMLERSLPGSYRLTPLVSTFLVIMMLASTYIVLTYFNQGRAVRAAGGSFIFTAAGDYFAQNKATTANLQAIAPSKASFHLALGDINENSAVTAAQWSSSVKSQLPTNFPFEILPGDHDTSQVSTYAANLPDRMGSTGTYAQQYYFDYPRQGPLARFIMLAPSQISGINYTKGSAGYRWVSSTIDTARAASIPWVIVGMYMNCFSLGSQHCSKDDLLNLLVSKKVDLVLYAHKHDYEASKQLSFNGTTCTALTTASYNAACVVNAAAKMTKGAGSVIVIIGTGGASMTNISASDPARGYFRTWEASNLNPTWGISQFAVSANQVAMQFVGTSGGTFTDSFTLGG